MGHFRAGLAVRADDPFLWALLADQLALRGEKVGEAEARKIVYRLSPSFPKMNTSDAFMNSFDPNQIIQQGERIIAQNPKFKGGYLLSSIGWLRKGELVRAEARSLEGLRLAARDKLFTDHHVKVGRAWADAGKPDDAARCFRAVVAQDPDHAGARAGLGRYHLVRGEPDEAVAEFQRALRAEPESAESRAGLDDALAKRSEKFAAEGRLAPPPRAVDRP
jgi:tetratricopeptide (TPR) repeat protein